MMAGVRRWALPSAHARVPTMVRRSQAAVLPLAWSRALRAPLSTLSIDTWSTTDAAIAAAQQAEAIDTEAWIHSRTSTYRGDSCACDTVAACHHRCHARLTARIVMFVLVCVGVSAFLAGATDRTKALFGRVKELLVEELNKGVLDIDTVTPSSITSHAPGYLDKEKELVVGMQTDAPLKRAIKPFGGINVVMAACKSYGRELDADTEAVFRKYRTTHNDGVFKAYTPEMRMARKVGIITGLPDAYGRGRIIGDYRRVALYGVDELIAHKRRDKLALGPEMDEATIRLREEVSMQIAALEALKVMAKEHGDEFDVSRPAANAREAVQWTYFGYLAAVKEQDGAAMSLGRLDSFFDAYIEADIASGKMTESDAQELIDDFVMKLRLVRHLRTPAYNELFAGDPTWVTLVLGGMGSDGEPLVTKTSYRFLQTLYNLGPAPEPNMTVLWDDRLPADWKEFCAQASIDTSSIQYEGDQAMRASFGHDYGVACCVSGMALGKEMQFFGARCNLPKLLLASLNGGRDEVSGMQVGPVFATLPHGGPLKYDEVMANFDTAMDWLAGLYCNTMNIIHYMHDKYCYEALQMALHDTQVKRNMAFGIAGLSVVADSLSAVKHASVTPLRDPETGLTTGFDVAGDFPKFGNDDDAVDDICVDVTRRFIEKLRKHKTYRDSEHSVSILTITSNVVYGHKTGATPDGRGAGQPFAPGANPMHGRDTSGALASLNSVAKIPYENCHDGISNTFSLVPTSLGKTARDRVSNLQSIIDGYFDRGAQHLNVNVLSRETLLDAVDHPERYPQLTIRVSGCTLWPRCVSV